MSLTINNYRPKHQATMLVVIAPGVEASHSLVAGVQPEAAVLLLDPNKDSVYYHTKI